MDENIAYILNEFEKFRDDYEKCRELGTKLAWAHGWTRYAIKPLERALELLPENRPPAEIVQLHEALSIAYLFDARPEKAVDILNAGLEQFSSSQALLSRLLDAHFSHVDHDAINETYKRAKESYDKTAKKRSSPADKKIIKLLYPADIACMRFGELASKLDLYIKSRILGLKDDCHAVFLAVNPRPINLTLYDYFKKVGARFIEFVDDKDRADYLTKHYAGAVEHMDYLELPDGRTCQRTFSSQVIQRLWEEQKRPPLIKPNRKHKKAGMAYLESQGLRPDDWFVTLHIRSSNTYKDQTGSKEDNHNLVRDSDVDEYLDAARAVTDAGGWVIRIGDPNMPKFPPMDRVIDYAHDPARENWLDLFLMAQSKFLLCSNSGPAIVAVTLGTPIVGINWFPLHAWSHGTRDLLIHKTLVRRSDGTTVDMKTSCEYPLGGAHDQSVFKRADMDIIPNTPEEITEVTKEAIDTFIYGRERKLSAQEQIYFDTYADFADRAGVGMNPRPGYHFLMSHLDLLDEPDATT